MSEETTTILYKDRPWDCTALMIPAGDVLTGDFLFDEWHGASCVMSLPKPRSDGRIVEILDHAHRWHLHSPREIILVYRPIDEDTCHGPKLLS